MSNCKHKKTTFHYYCNECIEECLCCGLSRSVWEQGESDWLPVDIDEAIEEMEDYLRGIK
jgi:hypothetical protein